MLAMKSIQFCVSCYLDDYGERLRSGFARLPRQVTDGVQVSFPQRPAGGVSCSAAWRRNRHSPFRQGQKTAAVQTVKDAKRQLAGGLKGHP